MCDADLTAGRVWRWSAGGAGADMPYPISFPHPSKAAAKDVSSVSDTKYLLTVSLKSLLHLKKMGGKQLL
jgi:hypothetical protein